MWSKARVLSAVAGLSLLGVSSGAVAAIHLDVCSNQSAPLSQMASPGSQIIVADWNEYQWRHHHHPSNLNPNDYYYWGGRNRYQYPPGWFGGPPSGMATGQRRAYLEQRREVAINMQQQMLAIPRPLSASVGLLANSTKNWVFGNRRAVSRPCLDLELADCLYHATPLTLQLIGTKGNRSVS